MRLPFRIIQQISSNTDRLIIINFLDFVRFSKLKFNKLFSKFILTIILKIFKNTILEQYCEELSVKNGTVSPIGTQTEGTVVTVTCLKPKRYVLMGSKQVTCLANGSWSETPECRKCGKS